MRLNICPEGVYCRRRVSISLQSGGTEYVECGLANYPSSETDRCPRYKYCPAGLSVNADPDDVVTA